MIKRGYVIYSAPINIITGELLAGDFGEFQAVPKAKDVRIVEERQKYPRYYALPLEIAQRILFEQRKSNDLYNCKSLLKELWPDILDSFDGRDPEIYFRSVLKEQDLKQEAFATEHLSVYYTKIEVQFSVWDKSVVSSL